VTDFVTRLGGKGKEGTEKDRTNGTVEDVIVIANGKQSK
jgi:hypothetical protein